MSPDIKTKHTPTPWKTNGGKAIYRQGHHIAQMVADNTGWKNGRPVPREEEANENADFIVRAVNAYDAQREMIRELTKAAKHLSVCEYSGESYEFKCKDCVKSNVAIAKAEKLL